MRSDGCYPFAIRLLSKSRYNYDELFCNYEPYFVAQNYRHKKITDEGGASQDIPATYIGIRQPLYVIKPEFNRATLNNLEYKYSNIESKRLEEQRCKKDAETARNKPKPRAKLVKMMAVDTTKGDQIATLHLPRLMKSFLPSVSRTGQNKIQHKSSWVDLTSRQKIKQVAPADYKDGIKPSSKPQQLTMFTVNYKASPPTRLQRRPLPPINIISHTPRLQSRGDLVRLSRSIFGFQQSISPLTAWQPPYRQKEKTKEKVKKIEEKHEEKKSMIQAEETKSKALEVILEKLDKAGQISLPNEALKGGLSNSKPTEYQEGRNKHKILRSRRHRRMESDRHFGNFKNGVVLNKLPADLMGNVHSNFQSLEYYLGRTDESKKFKQSSEKVVYIPTGRLGEHATQYKLDNVDDDIAQHYFMQKLKQDARHSDVKIKYAHRDSNETTPPLHRLPWEDEKSPAPYPNNAYINASDVNISDIKQKFVKHVTVNMPKVPPPSPEQPASRPKSRRKQRKTSPQSMDHCRCCDANVTRKTTVRFETLPEIPTKLPSLVETEEKGRVEKGDASYHFTTFDAKLKSRKSLATLPSVNQEEKTRGEKIPHTKSEGRKKLMENLISAHGEMKRRHKCPKKEVVIAPFKVSIVENSESKSLVHKRESKHSTRSTVTKPFTFSYMPSKERKRVSNSDEREQRKTPKIFNECSQSEPVRSERREQKSSLISSFVPTNQSQQIYEAILKRNQPSYTLHDNTSSSLNKATDCDDLGDPIDTSQEGKFKGRDQIKTSLLSHGAIVSDVQERGLIVA